jgi:hypothetical protein
MFKPQAISAILVGDPNWAPSQVPTGRWFHGATGEELPGPAIPEAIPEMDYPLVWRLAPRLYWNGQTVIHLPTTG